MKTWVLWVHSWATYLDHLPKTLGETSVFTSAVCLHLLEVLLLMTTRHLLLLLSGEPRKQQKPFALFDSPKMGNLMIPAMVQVITPSFVDLPFASHSSYRKMLTDSVLSWLIIFYQTFLEKSRVGIFPWSDGRDLNWGWKNISMDLWNSSVTIGWWLCNRASPSSKSKQWLIKWWAFWGKREDFSCGRMVTN